MIHETWYGATGHRNITEWIQEQLGIWARQYNLPAIEQEIVNEIEENLPYGYSFHHLAFHRDEKLQPRWSQEINNDKAPVDSDGWLDTVEFVESVDFWAIADTNEKIAGCANSIPPGVLA